MKIRFKKCKDGKIIHEEEVVRVRIILGDVQYKLSADIDGFLVVNKVDFGNKQNSIQVRPMYANEILIK